ncbi:MAG: ribbon-helix-helix domain-containing protein, partial [Desulfobacterota bacterium]|nr:ribbon-helix-helix domain-containing protein [Thermodesulfobacteriota bacterium]
MIRTQIQLTKDQARAVKKMSADRGVSMAEFIRQAVEGLIKSSPDPDRQEKIKRARKIVGQYKSGKGDVSN